MQYFTQRTRLGLLAFCFLTVVGFTFALSGNDLNSKELSAAGKHLPSVVTISVQSKDVSASVEYVGRSEASQLVDIRARVDGVLLKRPFKEGSDVKAGELLFAIDPVEFEAEKAAKQADVAKAKAAVEEAKNNLARYQELLDRNVTSAAKYDEAKADDGKSRAELAGAMAALKKAQIDLDYTNIVSPIAGRSGRAKADVGNLIGSSTGVLVTILKLDPIYVTFAIGERDYLTHKEAEQNGDTTKLIPRIRLANGQRYPHEGKFDLIDNQVDPETGTISVRVSFPNPGELLVPGQFVNVVLTDSIPKKQIVIPQVAIQENQTGPFVLVVGSDDRVEVRPITTGQRIGPDIVALKGLNVGETIIVEGIQKVRPGGEVNPVLQKSQKPQKPMSKKQ